MPAETPFLSDYPVSGIMDFSGNNRNRNRNMNMNMNINRNMNMNRNRNLNMNMNTNMNTNMNEQADFPPAAMNDQELLRRLAASRAAAAAAGMSMSSMGQDSGSFGFGARLHGAGMAAAAGQAGQQGSGPMFGQGLGGIAQNQFVGSHHVGVPSSGGNRPAGTPTMNAGMQSDREEELLLQLLLARRRRQELQNEFNEQAEARSNSNNFPEELTRLRQAGGAAAASSAATAAMRVADQDQHQHQHQHLLQLQQQQNQQQHQQNQQRGNVNVQGSGLLNLASGGPASNYSMIQDQIGNAPLRSPGMNMNRNANTLNTMNMNTNTNTNAFGRRSFDDYLLQHSNQQPHSCTQESLRAGGLSADQQRIELSPGRFRSLQQQEGPAFADFGLVGGANTNKRSLLAMHDIHAMRGGDLGKVVELEPPPAKKKRLHKKKPSDMPRRPLSAYNLFFSEERERILKEIDKADGDKKDISTSDNNNETEDQKNKQDKNEQKDAGDDAKKPRALLRPLLPSEKKRRPHRKTHGKISFRLLAQMVGQRWKALPDERRQYYQNLAKEDMARQKKAMEEYYQKQSEKVKDSKQPVDADEKDNEETTDAATDNGDADEKDKK